VTAKGRPLVTRPNLVGASVPDLLEALKAPEQWTRLQAKRVLKERGAEKVLPELDKLRKPTTETLDESYLLELLRTYQAFGSEQRVLLDTLIKAHDHRVRAAATRVQSDWITPAGLKLLLNAVDDSHPLVRLEGVRAFAKVQTPQAVEYALRVLDKPLDRTLDYALWLTIRELEPYWLPEFQAGRLTFGGDARKLAFALNAIGNMDTLKPVLALIEGGKVPHENLQGIYLLLTQIGGAEELAKVLTYASKHATPARRDELVRAVEDAVRTRKLPPPRDASGLTTLLGTDGSAKQASIRIAGAWKLVAHRGLMELLASAPDTAAPVRAAALEGLALFADAQARETITRLCGKSSAPEVRRLAITALTTIDLSAAAMAAADFLTVAPPEQELGDLFAAFVNRKGGAALLAKALAGKKVQPDIAKIGLKAVRASIQSADDLTATLTRAGDLALARKPPTPEEVRAITADVLANGNAARGELLYRRKELQCLACHAYAGAGGQVGPDMTSIGASAQADYLVESLLLPSKAIKENYDVTRVVTVDDKVIQGIRIRETGGILVLRSAEDKEIDIPIKDIAERTKSTKSLMPEGLTDQLTKQEFADLVKFLTELGKVGGPYAPNKARIVRRWQVIDPTPANLNLFRRTRVAAAAEADNPFTWSPAYARVSGQLPLSELPKFSVWADTAQQSTIRFQLDVTTPGTVKLNWNSVEGLTVFEGNSPVETKAEMLLDLKAGIQTITVLIDRSRRLTEDLRVELEDVDKSPARVSVVAGK
jgi:putative heme-binding domain-containing protein